MDMLALIDEIWAFVLHSLPEVISLRHKITWKPDGSPVTEADFLLENMIGNFLKNKIEGLQLIAEESYKVGMNLPTDWTAVLDPIDGTENFCSGLKEWGIALSIWHNGKHVASALMLPELGDMLRTGMGIPNYRSRIVGLSSSYNKSIGQAIAENPESRIMGCAVYNMYNVIRGSYARFLNPKGAYCWDLLAGVALAHENGCTIYIEGEPYNGQFLDPNKRHRIDIQR